MNLFGLFSVRINDASHIQMVQSVDADDAHVCLDCNQLSNGTDLVRSKYGSSCPRCGSRQVYSQKRLQSNVKDPSADTPKVKPVGRLPKSGVFIH